MFNLEMLPDRAADRLSRDGNSDWLTPELDHATDSPLILTALRDAELLPGDGAIIFTLAREQHGRAWDRGPGRTVPSLLAALRSLPVNAGAMATLFGPQWPEVASIINRAGAITDATTTATTDFLRDLRTQLDDHRETVCVSIIAAPDREARTRHFNLVSKTAMRATRHAVHAAVTEGTQGNNVSLARDAVPFAAVAVALRDLLLATPSGREAYAALTALWRAITTEPVHPDDA